MPPSSPSSKLCFNTHCTNSNPNPNPSPNGWRLRSGELAQLCDSCAVAYVEGRYCETYHSNASGWRCCESCGKRVHCGCIVSVISFTLLDQGGIECNSCAWKNDAAALKHAWPASSQYEKLKDLPLKSCNHCAGSSLVPWRQASSLFSSSAPSDFCPMVPKAVEIATTSDRPHQGETLPTSLINIKVLERLTKRLRDGNVKSGSAETLESGNADKDSLQNGKESGGETQKRSGKPRMNGKGINQVVPQYLPQVTNQNLQQIAGDSISATKPLFEKMLTASDAGKMGRLILPKRCAEAYLPRISRPDGLPLEVQDAKGKKWKLQFRYWPNNNSRMYVLEGVTPYIQNMHLQAGDIVTFSRLEPEGQLLMGFRKASAGPSFKEDQTMKNGNVEPTHGNVDLKYPDSLSKVDKPGCMKKEAPAGSTSVPRKRKNSTLGFKSKHLRIATKDLLKLKLTFEEAKRLLRPPPSYVPTLVVIEGFEFEEYEDAPVIGKPTISATDNAGETIQWVQCEDCQKWRKLPADALLPSTWTCSGSLWDPDRSFCKVAQELTAEQLEDLLYKSNLVAAKKLKATVQNREIVGLSSSAFMGESGSCPISSQASTKKPHHKRGCTCIVCVQPPSGKVPKHDQSCPCNVCLKRRFCTLALQHEKEQAEKAAGTTDSAQYQLPVVYVHSRNDASSCCPNQQLDCVNECCDDDSKVKNYASPPRGHFDLNFKPEQEDESLPGSSNMGILKMLQDAHQRYYTQQRLIADKTSEIKQKDPVKGLSVEKLVNSVNTDHNHQDAQDHKQGQYRLASAAR